MLCFMLFKQVLDVMYQPIKTFASLGLVSVALGAAFVSPDAHMQQQLSGSTQSTFLGGSIFRQESDVSVFSAGQDEFYIENDFHLTNDFTPPYSGIATFAHLNWTNCFVPASDETFDIGIVGAPFDLGVTYRPGERFGPLGVRSGSRRLDPGFAYRQVTCISSKENPRLTKYIVWITA